MVSNANTECVEAARDVLRERLGQYLGSGGAYALLDFPANSNVGDSAIWLGELALLEDLSGRPPSYVCTVDSFDPNRLEADCPQGPVFINGGGNTGDIWPKHQVFRERILQTLKARRVVQLPQSIHFADPQNATAFARIVERHPDFHMLVRDHFSFDFAERVLGARTTLVPDMAFGLGTINRPIVDPKFFCVCLMRTDVEAAGHTALQFARSAEVNVTDWVYSQRRLPRLARRVRRVIDSAVRPRSGLVSDRVRFESLARGHVERGLRILSNGRFVVTDRLHAHILCTLMGIPHVALDNANGKVWRFIEAWTASAPLVRRAASVSEAMSKLEEWSRAPAIQAI